jgi:hypothetical protein
VRLAYITYIVYRCVWLCEANQASQRKFSCRANCEVQTRRIFVSETTNRLLDKLLINCELTIGASKLALTRLLGLIESGTAVYYVSNVGKGH